jgi:2-oxoisovalerate dehydrogenase E2 component (dihydrolipoyl transacylase)
LTVCRLRSPYGQNRLCAVPTDTRKAVRGRFATLVVVPPQVAIVGRGRAGLRVRVHRGKVAARRILPLSVTFDHRVVTGREAAHFLVALRSNLERA